MKNISIDDFKQQNPKILKEILGFFNERNLQIHVGIESEFYANDQIIEELKQFNIKKEQGENQFEIIFFTKNNLKKLIDQFGEFKKTALLKGANFDGVFNQDDCFSALQINITIVDKHFNNIFDSNQNILHNAIAGILELSKELMPIYCPIYQDKKRFDLNLNRQLFRRGKYVAPTILNWGFDNRTCAIRVVKRDNKKTLEFRLPCANCDLESTLYACLFSLIFGIKNNLNPPEPTYGNSFDEQYQDHLFLQNI